MKFVCECELIEKEWLNSSYFRLRFNAPEIVSSSKPGQFINCRFANKLDPLLSRPMSIYRCNRGEGWLDLLIKLVGKATLGFSQAEPGDRFTLVGPLGRGFDFSNVEQAFLIGGGIGIAPLVFLAEQMSNNGIEPVFIGGFLSGREVCCVDEIEPFVKRYFVTTDDGSYGFRGMVTDKFRNILENKNGLSGSSVFCCGPNPMMSALEKICDQYELKAQFSLEAHMACGFGVCAGCAVPAKNNQKYLLVCEHGPVFYKGEANFGS